MVETISVIIPTYNRAALIERSLNSVLHQTVSVYEIMIIDDASIDDTEHIVKKYADKRIIYLRHNARRGGAAARNTGILNSSGMYIAFLDSDDEWVPLKLEKQIRRFKEVPDRVGCIYTGYSKMLKSPQNIIPELKGNIAENILIGNFIGTTSTPLIKRDCLLKAGMFDESLPSAQDWDLWIRMSRITEFDYVSDVLVHYYVGQDSITKDRNAKVRAYEIIERKYAADISSLSAKSRAEHYFYIGKMLWWSAHTRYWAKYFIKAFLLWPYILPRIGHLIIRGARTFILKRLGITTNE